MRTRRNALSIKTIQSVILPRGIPQFSRIARDIVTREGSTLLNHSSNRVPHSRLPIEHYVEKLALHYMEEETWWSRTRSPQYELEEGSAHYFARRSSCSSTVLASPTDDIVHLLNLIQWNRSAWWWWLPGICGRSSRIYYSFSTQSEDTERYFRYFPWLLIPLNKFECIR